MYFRASDAPKLWNLAARHWPEEDRDETISRFAQAARATERGLPIVVSCEDELQLEHVAAFFHTQGIEPPRIEELRV